MPNLPNDIESLKALIQQLLGGNAQLKAENAELRRRLGLDSKCASPPPGKSNSPGRWQRELGPAQKALVNRKLGNALEQFGYTVAPE